MGAQLDVCLGLVLTQDRREDDSPESELVKLAVAGDREAFAALVDGQYDFIFRVAFKWLGDKSDAEDVTQNVVIKLAKSIHQFDGRSKFSSWLYRISLNAVRDHQRISSRQGRNVAALSLISPTAAPSNQEDDVALNEVWAAVQRLPEKQRDAVLMVYGDDMNHAECASVMACKESTVSCYVHEAKKSLKGLL